MEVSQKRCEKPKEVVRLKLIYHFNKVTLNCGEVTRQKAFGASRG